MKFFREIRKVGLRDWLWFVVFIRRDEFHPRLNRINYPRGREGSIRCVRDRDRAHRIDEALS